MLEALKAEAVTAEGPYRQWDDMAVELETAEFLYGLVRIIKPRLVLESGAGRGILTAFLGQACADNKTGRVLTWEPDDRFGREARERVKGLPVEFAATWHVGYPPDLPDLVVLDSGPDYRPDEIAYWLPTRAPLAIHDAHRYQLDGGFMLNTQRGLWVRL